MENEFYELKAQVAKLASELSKIRVEHAEDRVFYKSLSSSVNAVSDQVTTLDKLMEATQKTADKPTKKTPQKADKDTKEMSLTELGELYKSDPVAGRKAMEAQGMSPDIGPNPWKQRDTFAQRVISEKDPELAKRLQAEARPNYSHLS